ncbi:MAG: FCD domain-containing protein [Acidimicrobiales bacterium]|jgi:GntR family transcriptional regulator, transcriptional repressor for pyruvate dehydrogenase complex
MINNRPPKTAVIVAQRIMRDVVRRGVKAGDPLPPEHSMLEVYGAGRGTLREALRLLESQGVILIKPGPGGGPVLLDPDATHLADTIVLLMELKGAPFRSIAEVRMAMEPMISALAAKHISEESLDELQLTIKQMTENIEDEYLFLETNKRFHDIIAWSSGNALFGYLVESLLEIMDGTVIGVDYPPSRRAGMLKAHEEIYEALSARDPQASESRMREHVDAYVSYIERKFPQAMERTIPWGYS